MNRVDWTHFHNHLFDRLNGNPRVDCVEYIDSRIDDLTSVIHEAIAASAPKSQPPKQQQLSIPSTILANIREKDRFRRLWQIDHQDSNQ